MTIQTAYDRHTIAPAVINATVVASGQSELIIDRAVIHTWYAFGQPPTPKYKVIDHSGSRIMMLCSDTNLLAAVQDYLDADIADLHVTVSSVIPHDNIDQAALANLVMN